MAWIILKQAILMLLLNVVGIIAYRTKVVDKNGGRQFSNFVLEIVTPVLVVNAYADVEYESRLVVNMLWTFLLAAAAYGIFIAAVYLLIRPKPGRETEIERFSAIYSNCGFMGIPLASAILGKIPVLGAALSALLSLASLALMIIGIINAANGKAKQLPLIGGLFHVFDK